MSTTEAFFRSNTGLPKGGGLPRGSGGLPISKPNPMKYKKIKNKAEKAMETFSEESNKDVQVAGNSSPSDDSKADQ